MLSVVLVHFILMHIGLLFVVNMVDIIFIIIIIILQLKMVKLL